MLLDVNSECIKQNLISIFVLFKVIFQSKLTLIDLVKIKLF